MIYSGLSSLKDHFYLNMMGGITAYDFTLLVLAFGLVVFFKNMKEGFEVSLFW